MKKCIFCDLIKNKEKDNLIYQDKKIIILLDISPIAKGHCLVIPKKHYENIFDIKKQDLMNIIINVKKISNILKNKLNATGINILHASGIDAQQSVFHFHIHIVPRYKNDNLNTWPKSSYKEINFKKIKKLIKDEK